MKINIIERLLSVQINFVKRQTRPIEFCKFSLMMTLECFSLLVHFDQSIERS